MAARSMRACMVLPQAQFSRTGCPNCEDFLELRGNSDVIQEATSQVFEGLVTIVDPEHSWVAKWQRLQDYKPGTYAIKVVGLLSEDFVAAAENAGVKYIPRDGSAVTDDH
ncbi:transcription elongation factor spt4 [Teratosphaeriaceae sp. CCFEE 6253]|nr:transcription elongation factor spt4 [Teratosphaeriaceae sp. CCFEE 6253]